jgi:phospholipid transport system transporter-binding protein
MSAELFSIVFDAEKKIIRVSGELSYTTVSDVLLQANDIFAPVAELKIDLADVTRSDSAGLALMIDWMRTANTLNKKIAFYNIPAQMLAIASASGMDDLLPLQTR